MIAGWLFVGGIFVMMPFCTARRVVAAALVVSAMGLGAPVAPAVAQGIASPMTSLLGQASDSALTKLAKPGAFYADDAVRIALPGPLKKASGLLRLADQSGLTNGLSKSLNDAAGMAADQAKPIFRAAISRMTLKDGVGIIGKSDGATTYLRQSAGVDLSAKILPIVSAALGKTGAFAQLDKVGSSGLLSGVGISRDGLTKSVTDQTMDGIFKYMSAEEERMRANPLSLGKKLLGGIGQ